MKHASAFFLGALLTIAATVIAQNESAAPPISQWVITCVDEGFRRQRTTAEYKGKQYTVDDVFQKFASGEELAEGGSDSTPVSMKPSKGSKQNS